MADSVMSKADNVHAFAWARGKNISSEITVQEDAEQNSATKTAALPHQSGSPFIDPLGAGSGRCRCLAPAACSSYAKIMNTVRKWIA